MASGIGKSHYTKNPRLATPAGMSLGNDGPVKMSVLPSIMKLHNIQRISQRSAAAILSLFVIATLSVACTQEPAAPIELILTAPAGIESVQTFGTPPGTIGNMHTFVAPISEDGSVVGYVSGQKVLTKTADMLIGLTDNEDPRVVADIAIEEWHQTMTFNLPGRGTIDVAGDRLLNVDPQAAFPNIKKVAPQALAIIGGTGEFRFARGEVITVLDAGNGYTQTLTYLLD